MVVVCITRTLIAELRVYGTTKEFQMLFCAPFGKQSQRKLMQLSITIEHCNDTGE